MFPYVFRIVSVLLISCTFTRKKYHHQIRDAYVLFFKYTRLVVIKLS